MLTLVRMKLLLVIFLLPVSAFARDEGPGGASLAKTPLAAYSSDASTAKKVWWDRFGTAAKDFICYAPGLPAPEWKVVGHRGQQNHGPLKDPIMGFKQLEDGALAKVTGFEFLWDDRFGTNIQDASLWRPSCPSGYVALGDVFYPANYITVPGQDLFDSFRCVRIDLTETCIPGDKVWDDGGSTSWYDISVWEPLASSKSVGGYLYGNNQHAHPPKITMKCLLKTSYTVVYEA